MRILILGGTVFLGRHLAALALQRGHDLTLLHRGQHGRDLFPEAERRIADRDGGLAVLAGGRWEVAIDTCGYVPRVVGASAAALADAVEHYTFVSTLSVHDDEAVVGRTETSSVGTLEDATTETVDGATYGPLKALCEQAAEAALPGRTLAERRVTGTYNAVGPAAPTLHWVPWPFLEEEGVAPFADLPLWIPDVPAYSGASAFDCTKAVREGLGFRPLSETVVDTLAWARTRPDDHTWRAGLSAAREEALLAASDLRG